jgi:hypothetical protein
LPIPTMFSRSLRHSSSSWPCIIRWRLRNQIGVSSGP